MKYNNSHSRHVLNKVDFWNVFVPAWNSSMCPKNIIVGFRKRGIHPFNPQVIPAESLAPSLVTDRESAGNGEAELSVGVHRGVMLMLRILSNLLYHGAFPPP